MVDSDTVDPVVTEIVTTVSNFTSSLMSTYLMVLYILGKIFNSLRGSGIELREICGKCLGELGAVDPGKYVSSVAPFHTP